MKVRDGGWGGLMRYGCGLLAWWKWYLVKTITDMSYKHGLNNTLLRFAWS